MHGAHSLVLELTNNLTGPDRSTLIYSWNIIIDEITISELDPAPGTIELVWEEQQEFVVSATDGNDYELSYSWLLDDEEVSSDSTYTFIASQNENVTHILQLHLSNVQNRDINKKQTTTRAIEIFEWTINVTATSSPDDLPNLTTTLYGNSPNPFYTGGSNRSTSTTIDFYLEYDSDVELTVYNVKGQKVITLLNETQEKGLHEVNWNGLDSSSKPVSSGVYFYIMQAGEKLFSKKMLVVK